MGKSAAQSLQLNGGKFAKDKTVTTRRHKFTCSAFIACILAMGLPQESRADSQDYQVSVYAGPQSITPNEIIHVTLEVTTLKGENIHNEPVELFYETNGTPEVRRGIARNGLATFDISAQKTAGLMTFSGRYKTANSQHALVLVAAAAPKDIKLQFSKSTQTGSVKVISDAIKDHYGNDVSDLSLVSLNLIDNNNLITSQDVQLFKGQIHHDLVCPTKFKGPLKVQARINNITSMSTDISGFCRKVGG